MSLFSRRVSPATFSPSAPDSGAHSDAVSSDNAVDSEAELSSEDMAFLEAEPVPALRGVQAFPAHEAVRFEEIVERYHGKVFQLAFRYLGDYDEACDVTQDTFVRAYNAWRDFRGESQIYTWLYRIAINLCHNQQKKLQRRRRFERVSLDNAPDDNDGSGAQWNSREVADERPLPTQLLESQELRARLQEALAELPDNYRTVIILRDIEGLTYEEIAKITDSTLEAIKSRLFRARGAIRRLLEPYLLGPLPGSAEPTATQSRRVPARRGAQNN
ncbi:MAG TPA: sigma-70 family RNA polymerase sigma factor [Abditibacteriaceae bacterium]|jgi:RNA polymerase sigma-70 factor (ECF subfamily)